MSLNLNSDHQGYLERYAHGKARIETLEQEKFERTAKSKTIGRFIHSVRGTSELIAEFDETLWNAIINHVVVMKDAGLVFRFKNNLEITFHSI